MLLAQEMQCMQRKCAQHDFVRAQEARVHACEWIGAAGGCRIMCARNKRLTKERAVRPRQHVFEREGLLVRVVVCCRRDVDIRRSSFPARASLARCSIQLLSRRVFSCACPSIRARRSVARPGLCCRRVRCRVACNAAVPIGSHVLAMTVPRWHGGW